MMNYNDIEIQGMKEILRDKEKEIKKLNEELEKSKECGKFRQEENKELKERIRFLEQCLDNKEKVNKSLREELEIGKLTAKDYAKQCGVELDDDLKI